MRIPSRWLLLIIGCQFCALIFLLTCSFPSVLITETGSSEPSETERPPENIKTKSPVEPERIDVGIHIPRENYATIQAALIKAYRLSRDSETRLSINKVLKLLNSEEIKDQVVQRPSLETGTKLEVCPESWGESKSDEDHFDDAYEIADCDRIPRDDLVEILLYSNLYAHGMNLVKRIRLVYPTIQIHLALAVTKPPQMNPKLPKVNIIWGRKDDASTWLTLSQAAKTKYILVGRNMVDFTYHSDIDRMLRAVNTLQVDVVGGAVRLEPEGQWYAGCYQAVIRNFTLRIHPGHDISAQSCAVCDYIASPFLMRRTEFQKHMPDTNLLSGPVAFVRMFMGSLHQTGVSVLQTLACVDVMFHVAGKSYSIQSHGVSETAKSSWLELARQWSIVRILLPGDVDHQWTCEEVHINCYSYKVAGVILPKCCIEELANCVKGFFELADKHDVGALVVFGTAVGAVKISGGFLPWERDADLIWDAHKHATVSGPIKDGLQKNYQCRLSEARVMTKFGYDIKACSKITNGSCLYHSLHSSSWRIEMYGEPVLVSSTRLQGLQNPTTVNLDGLWVPTLMNPGRFVRVLYGDNVLGHVQNWVDYGMETGWARYTKVEKKGFLPCPQTTVKHACLAGNYLPYGNIQFQHVPI